MSQEHSYYYGNQSAPKSQQKRCDCKCVLNTEVLVESRMSDSRVFQIVGAATENLRAAPVLLDDQDKG